MTLTPLDISEERKAVLAELGIVQDLFALLNSSMMPAGAWPRAKANLDWLAGHITRLQAQADAMKPDAPLTNGEKRAATEAYAESFYAQKDAPAVAHSTNPEAR
jgi:outer membrane murein-binding lipoprotein Lpp